MSKVYFPAIIFPSKSLLTAAPAWCSDVICMCAAPDLVAAVKRFEEPVQKGWWCFALDRGRPSGGKVRHKRQALQDMARPLKQWLYKHRDNPYPTKTEKILLALGSQMTLVQVSPACIRLKNGKKKRLKIQYAKCACKGGSEIFLLWSELSH